MKPETELVNYSGSELVRRHCLTALLVILFLFEVSQVLTLQSWGAVTQKPPVPIFILVACALANVFCVIAMCRWHRWGFIGFVISTAVAIATNIVAGLDGFITVVGLITITLLSLAIYTGGSRSEWTHFK